jgi:hypothetical protein
VTDVEIVRLLTLAMAATVSGVKKTPATTAGEPTPAVAETAETAISAVAVIVNELTDAVAETAEGKAFFAIDIEPTAAVAVTTETLTLVPVGPGIR